MIESCYRRIGARIRELRIDNGLTQAELGRCLRPEHTRASIANIETAKQRLMLHTAIEIARAFGIGIEDIVVSIAPRRRRAA